MISYFRSSDNGEFCMVGLSTDTKPVEDIPNGAIFVEMDTGLSYRFDKTTENYFQSATGGGGDIVIHGTQVITENGTYDIWDKDEVVVNVSGGGGGLTAFLEAPMDGPFAVSDASARYIHPECFCFYADDSETTYQGYQGLPVTDAAFPSVQVVDYYAFYGCSMLSSASFPSLQSIGNRAFAGCSALATISLPSIASLGIAAFEDCESLSEVYLLGESVCSVMGSPFKGTPIGAGEGTIYVPASLYSEYLEDSFWGSVGESIQPYSDGEEVQEG